MPRSALCVVYTPHREHFGIVPLEAMYAGSPVIAVNSGGPKETVVHEETGLLVENTVEGFASALEQMVNNPTGAVEMGRKGHERVVANFGLDTFRARWADIVEETMERGAQRRHRWESGHGLEYKRIFPFWFTCMFEAMLALLAALLLTFALMGRIFMAGGYRYGRAEWNSHITYSLSLSWYATRTCTTGSIFLDK